MEWKNIVAYGRLPYPTLLTGQNWQISVLIHLVKY